MLTKNFYYGLYNQLSQGTDYCSKMVSTQNKTGVAAQSDFNPFFQSYSAFPANYNLSGFSAVAGAGIVIGGGGQPQLLWRIIRWKIRYIVGFLHYAIVSPRQLI